MIKKGDNEIIALYKGDVEIYRLINKEQVLYDADRVNLLWDEEDEDTLIICTDNCARIDNEEDCLVLVSKPWNNVSLENR